MRKFKFADDKSYKFWNIELQDSSYTVAYGRIGTKGQSKTKEYAGSAEALKAYDKIIVEKLREGYVEITPPAAALGTQQVLEKAILDDPDDVAAHAAYADWLSQQGDPRGEFIQIQLLLEDPSQSAKERKTLQKREAKLLEDHSRQWLGTLADTFLNPPETQNYLPTPFNSFQFQFARGWLDFIHVPELTVKFARLLAAGPETQLLRRLVIYSTSYEEEFEPGEDVPDTEHPALYPLLRSPYLGNVRHFQLGESYEDSRWGGPGCHTYGEGAVDLVARMPRIEELYLLAHDIDGKKLFALKNLGSLRKLQMDHSYDYPLEILTRNPVLDNLTHLLLHPHGLDQDDPYIRLEHVRALTRSTHLNKLRYLRICCSDFGDEGCSLIRSSGLLGRLKVLELTHGCISDTGLQELADAAEIKNLELLDLSYNALSPEGVKALKKKAAGITVRAEEQHNAAEIEDRLYLFEADPE